MSAYEIIGFAGLLMVVGMIIYVVWQVVRDASRSSSYISRTTKIHLVDDHTRLNLQPFPLYSKLDDLR